MEKCEGELKTAGVDLWCEVIGNEMYSHDVGKEVA